MTNANPFAQGLERGQVLRLLGAIKGGFTKADYRAYQKTDHWKIVREEALEAAGHECRTCGGQKNLQVHHKNKTGYKRIFRERVGMDVTVCCSRCHRISSKPDVEVHKADRTREVPDTQGR